MPPLGLNAATLVGHGTVRAAVLGGEARAPRPDELERMAALVDEAMAAGAFGLSTGLFGPPSGYAATDEVVALARVAARHGGAYHTHMRDEGVRIAEAVDEALAISAQAGCPVQISHLKISSLDRWGRAPEILAAIAAARGPRRTRDVRPVPLSRVERRPPPPPPGVGPRGRAPRAPRPDSASRRPAPASATTSSREWRRPASRCASTGGT